MAKHNMSNTHTHSTHTLAQLSFSSEQQAVISLLITVPVCAFVSECVFFFSYTRVSALAFSVWLCGSKANTLQ